MPIPASAVRRKSLNVWISILAPEARQIIAGGKRFCELPEKIGEAESPEGAREYLAFRPFRVPFDIPKTGGFAKALTPGYLSERPFGTQINGYMFNMPLIFILCKDLLDALH
jgi:hypothetical protein